MSDTDLTKLAKLVKEVVKAELKPINGQINALTELVSGITEQVAYLTERVDGEIIPTLETHTKYLKNLSALREKNGDNIGRLNKRLSEVEAKSGIQAPVEFQIIK